MQSDTNVIDKDEGHTAIRGMELGLSRKEGVGMKDAVMLKTPGSASAVSGRRRHQTGLAWLHLHLSGGDESRTCFKTTPGISPAAVPPRFPSAGQTPVKSNIKDACHARWEKKRKAKQRVHALMIFGG